MIPDYCEAITAYRVFTVFENGLLAGSAIVEPWPPYEPFVARCAAVSCRGAGEHIRDGHFVSPPVYGCDCGIYAVKTRKAALIRIGLERLAPPALRLQHFGGPVGRAWGAVTIWGRVIEHEDGYRAEFAYPCHLHCEDAELARRVAALYGVPCDYTPLPPLPPLQGPLQPGPPTARLPKPASVKMGDYNQPLFDYQPRHDTGMFAIAVLLPLIFLTLNLIGINSEHLAPASNALTADTARTTAKGVQFAPTHGRLLPKHYERESLAAKQAHELERNRIADPSASVERDHQKLGVPGVSIGLVQDGMVLFTRGVAVKDISGTIKADADTLSSSDPRRRP